MAGEGRHRWAGPFSSRGCSGSLHSIKGGTGSAGVFTYSYLRQIPNLSAYTVCTDDQGIMPASNGLVRRGHGAEGTAEFIAHYRNEGNHQCLQNALIHPDPRPAVIDGTVR